jgi:hypothetical protein
MCVSRSNIPIVPVSFVFIGRQPVDDFTNTSALLTDVTFVSFPFRNPCGVATFGASTWNPNLGTAAITTRSALLLAIKGEVVELNNHLIPLFIRRRRESPAWQYPFEFSDSSGSRLNWPAAVFRSSFSRSSIQRTATHKLLYLISLIVCSFI